jgi:glutamate 5-kinase
MKKYKKVVLKIGSALISESNIASSRMINDLSEQVSLMNNSIDFIIVTSGAISQGMNILNTNEKPKDLESLQALAAIGQQQLVGLYEKSFKRFDKLTAQVLLTHDDMNDHGKYMNAKATIEKLLSLKVIPIINENDVVATEEIRFGDNDKLAAMVSNLISADLMIILTNQAGFFDKNPDKHDNAKLIKKCNISDININQFNIDEKSDLGTGGFKTKLQAVEMVYKNDIDSIIASGFEKDVLQRIFSGEDVGTFFKSET